MRVVVCDDHRLFGEGLAAVLKQRGLEVVACVTHPTDAASAVLEHDADVLLLDVMFPSGSGLGVIEEVRDLAPACRIVVLSAFSDSEATELALRAGADAYVSKDDDVRRVVLAVKEASTTSITTSVRVAHQRARSNEASDRRLAAQFLTPREQEVLTRLAEGQSTERLAREMGISYSTARTHIQNVLSKLGAHSKLEAVALAIEHSVVRLPSPASRHPG